MMRMREWIGGVFAILLGLSACSKVPDGILSEREMQQVLHDVLVAEAMAGIDYETYRTDTMKVALYQSVFRKHGIDQAKYDSSLIWYGRNLDIYIKVYDRVVADLNRQVADLGDVQAEAAPSSNSDSIDIWPRRRYLAFEPREPFNGVSFQIRPDKPYSSGSTFVLGMRVWGLRPDMKHKPRIRLQADLGDTTVVLNQTVDRDGYVEAALRTLATKRVKRVYGFIHLDDCDMRYGKIYLDSLSLMKYNYK